jgi:hypothetical protein
MASILGIKWEIQGLKTPISGTLTFRYQYVDLDRSHL